MSYYPSENKGKGYLRSGFHVKVRKPHTLDKAMRPCYEFDSHETCEKFCELLLRGFENIYEKYQQPELKRGDKVWWISVYSQSHLRELVVPQPATCKDPELYKYHYTFIEENDCNKALSEMQEFANKLYAQFSFLT